MAVKPVKKSHGKFVRDGLTILILIFLALGAVIAFVAAVMGPRPG